MNTNDSSASCNTKMPMILYYPDVYLRKEFVRVSRRYSVDEVTIINEGRGLSMGVGLDRSDEPRFRLLMFICISPLPHMALH